ncbi:hypothetical protein ACJMK2_025785, partial [Sinanodonta woodiana]
MDGSNDSEKLYPVGRYVDNTDGVVNEARLSVPTRDGASTKENMFTLLDDDMNKRNISLNNCIALESDNISMMTGCNKGVFRHITKVNPLASHVIWWKQFKKSHQIHLYGALAAPIHLTQVKYDINLHCRSGLNWTTETLHISSCEGQDRILMWNYSLEKNETVQNSMWFFQSTRIAYVSESGKFDMRDLYKSRLEQIGKMGILLKNVSSVDTGNYSLYLNLGAEPPENMQTIFLTVFESPTYLCKPSITKYSENVIFCSTNSCGGIQLSTEWRISEKDDFLSNASYLKINSSWNDEHVSCCLHRQYM